MLLCHASSLSSGLSLGSCAEHMKGKRAADKVCCERVGGRKTYLPSLPVPPAWVVRVHACVPVSARLPACANAQGCFFCQTPCPAVTMFKRQRRVMLCFKIQASGECQAAETVQGSVALRFSAPLMQWRCLQITVAGLCWLPGPEAVEESVSALALFTQVKLAK